MSHPVSLSGLTDREAIADALYRVVSGFDLNDLEIFNSGWASPEEESSFTMNDQKFDLPGLRNYLTNVIGPMDTQHLVTNIRISLAPGASTASLTAYAQNQHCAPGTGADPASPKFTAGSEYFVDYVKQDGEWKIKTWKMKIIWTQGDQGVMGWKK